MCGGGGIENTYVQGPEFGATPLRAHVEQDDESTAMLAALWGAS